MSESIAELSATTDLNPSFAVGQYTLGFALLHAGETVRSIERADKARRLSPYDPLRFAMIGVRGSSPWRLYAMRSPATRNQRERTSED